MNTFLIRALVLTLEKFAMKKTLIALAAVAVSGAAFAQSTVSITGNADVGYSKSTGAKGLFKHGGDNSTPAVNFSIVEDLGGGMSAQALYEINPNLAATTIGKGQAFVGLTGGFGTVRLGMPNTGLLATQAGRTPFGTALGSNYGAQLGSATTANTRMAGAIQYRAPAMGGFGIVIDHSPATAALEANTIFSISGAVAGVTLNFSNSQNHLGTADGRTDFSASAKLAGATLYFGHGKSDAAGQKAVNNIGAMYPMGAISLRANMAKQGDDSATTLGVQYDLSKRTNVYAKFDTTEKAGADVKTTAFGLRHSF
jgi:predicted porin